MGPERFYDHAVRKTTTEEDTLFMGRVTYDGEITHNMAIIMEDPARHEQGHQGYKVLTADTNPNNEELTEFAFAIPQGAEGDDSIHNGEANSEEVLDLRFVDTAVGLGNIMLTESTERPSIAREYVGTLDAEWGQFRLEAFIDEQWHHE